LSSFRKKAITSILWTIAERFSLQGLNFVIIILLTRMLLPEEFGLIGMITIFITIGNALKDSGLSKSLIRNTVTFSKDFSTVFILNLVVSIVIYIVLFFCAPFISSFFNQDILISIIRVYCLDIVINAFASVQLAILTKEMNFKKQLTISIPSLLIAGIFGVVLAYFGFGVWSLVYMNLLRSTLFCIQIWIRSNWRPRWEFDKERLWYHFDFGYKLTLASIMNAIFENAYNIIIGRFFSAAQLGYYTRAQMMKQMPVTNVSTALNQVTFPLFATIQDENMRLKIVYRKLMQQVLFWIAPILIFMGVLGEPLFRFLLTEKWIQAVPYFQILCIVGIMYPIQSYNLNILKVKGRSDLFLKLEVIKKILISISIVISLPFGIYGLLWSQVVVGLLAFIINSFYSGNMINYSWLDQLKDLTPILLISVICGLVVFFINTQFPSKPNYDIYKLITGGFIGVILYVLISKAFKLPPYQELKSIIITR